LVGSDVRVHCDTILLLDALDRIAASARASDAVAPASGGEGKRAPADAIAVPSAVVLRVLTTARALLPRGDDVTTRLAGDDERRRACVVLTVCAVALSPVERAEAQLALAVAHNTRGSPDVAVQGVCA
jgi:hypothetical protein